MLRAREYIALFCVMLSVSLFRISVPRYVVRLVICYFCVSRIVRFLLFVGSDKLSNSYGTLIEGARELTMLLLLNRNYKVIWRLTISSL